MKKMYVAFIGVLLFITSVVGEQFIRMQVVGNRTSSIYYTSVFVGTPKIQQKLVIDTGSSLTNFGCGKCVKCQKKNKLSQLYNDDASFTSEKVRCRSRKAICEEMCKTNKQFCEFTVNYLDGTQKIGNIIQDKMSLSQDSTSFVGFFGCNKYEHNQFEQTANGILGLAPKINQIIIYKWFLEDATRSPQFSICIHPDSGGFIEYGKYPQKIQYDHTIKFDFTSNSYQLKNPNSIKIGKILVADSSKLKGKVLLDTGASFTVVSAQMLSIIQQEIKAACKRNCQLIQDESSFYFYVNAYNDQDQFLRSLDRQFPSLFVEADGRTITIKPSAYFFNYPAKKNQKPAGKQIIYPKFTISPYKTYDQIILGISFFHNKKININLKEKTCYIKENFNCQYKPYHNIGDDNPKEISYQLDAAYSTIKEYYIIFLAVAVLIVAVIVYYSAICIKKILKNRKKSSKSSKRRKRNPNSPERREKKSKNRSNKMKYQKFVDETLKHNDEISENVISEKDQSQIQ